METAIQARKEKEKLRAEDDQRAAAEAAADRRRAEEERADKARRRAEAAAERRRAAEQVEQDRDGRYESARAEYIPPQATITAAAATTTGAEETDTDADAEPVLSSAIDGVDDAFGGPYTYTASGRRDTAFMAFEASDTDRSGTPSIHPFENVTFAEPP